MKDMTKKIALTAVITTCSFLVMAGSAWAASRFVTAAPKVYDRDRTRVITAKWMANVGTVGVDTRDGGKFAVFLQKTGATVGTNSSADINLKGTPGLTITELGFDYRNDGRCSGGSPRFTVETNLGTYFFGCSGGTHTAVPGNSSWTRVRFALSDAQGGPMPANAVVDFMQITFDEGTDQGQGFAYIDNIDVNGTIMSKPGSVKFP